ncbi:TPA: mechanosensitive ion channel [Candidatus Woesearchaeota archaeon]|nr:mechanosensitive ion channel [Candidatus Woesearchaeota archaeon]
MPSFGVLSSLRLRPADLFTRALNNFVLAAVVVLIGLMIGRISGRFTKRLLNELGLNSYLKRKTGINIAAEEFFEGIISTVIYIITAYFALRQLGIAAFIINLAAFIALIALLVSVLFVIRDFAPNIVAGLMIRQRQLIKTGDRISVFSVKGSVRELGLVSVQIRTAEGDTIIVPNAVFISHATRRFKKWS